jgi:hypothetical protein
LLPSIRGDKGPREQALEVGTGDLKALVQDDEEEKKEEETMEHEAQAPNVRGRQALQVRARAETETKGTMERQKGWCG